MKNCFETQLKTVAKNAQKELRAFETFLSFENLKN